MYDPDNIYLGRMVQLNSHAVIMRRQAMRKQRDYIVSKLRVYNYFSMLQNVTKYRSRLRLMTMNNVKAQRFKLLNF